MSLIDMLVFTVDEDGGAHSMRMIHYLEISQKISTPVAAWLLRRLLVWS